MRRFWGSGSALDRMDAGFARQGLAPGAAVSGPTALVLLGALPPPTGGVATHVALLSANLRVQGRDVAIVRPGQGVPGRVAAVMKAGTGWALLPELMLSLPRGALLHGHSILTAHPNIRLLAAFTKLVASRNTTWVETLHDGTLPARYGAWPGDVRRRYVALLSRCAHVIAVSEPLAAFAAGIGLPSSGISVIGPLLPEMTTRAADFPGSAQRFVAGHSPVLLAVGAFISSYDYATTVRAFAALLTSHPGAGLLIASSGFDRDPSYERRVRESAASLGESVFFVDDIDHAVLVEMMRRSDVVIRGAEIESYGLSRVEAMLTGTAVVGTRTGELSYVTPYEFGQPDSLLQAITAALQGPTPIEASAFFAATAKRNLESILAVYESALRR